MSTDLDDPVGPIRVLTGGSINLWQPDFGKPYAYAQDSLKTHLLDKAQRSSRMARSPFNGMTFTAIDDLPLARPRIVFRDVTRRTDARTLIACLIPPNSAVMHACPYILRRDLGEADEAFLLGVLSSIPTDWYARSIVELHMTFDLIGSIPIPNPSSDDPRRARVIEIAGRLAAVDERFGTWAAAVGVAVGSVSDDDERFALMCELDALVAHLYGLDRNMVATVFETFHVGWDHQPRLTGVLTYFDKLGATSA